MKFLQRSAHCDEIITARDLICQFLDLKGLTSSFDRWTEQCLKDNPPRLYRLRCLASLFRAFGLECKYRSFPAGRFIDEESDRYAGVFDAMLNQLPTGAREYVWHGHLRRCFRTLFLYRRRLDRVLSFSSGVLETSGLFYFAHLKADELNRVIMENVGIVDGVLSDLISPERKSFSVTQLIRDYGYPDVDLFEIDMQWI